MILNRKCAHAEHYRRDSRRVLAFHAGTIGAAGSSPCGGSTDRHLHRRCGRHGARHPRRSGADNDQPGGAEVHLAAGAIGSRAHARRKARGHDRYRVGRAPRRPASSTRWTSKKRRWAAFDATSSSRSISRQPSRDRVLINVHGGGFNSDSGSLVEGVPIAYLTATTVVSVYYRLAPEYPFPAAVDDTVAVYRELMKTHKPAKIGLYGTSAGAILTAEVAVRLRRDGLPFPGVLGIFSGTGDMSRAGDSQALYTVRGFVGLSHPPSKTPHASDYIGSTDPTDPVLSPIFADLKGFPPTLLVTSTRDLLLSGTTDLHRALLRSGVDAELVVFDALPHGFWYDYHLPETKEALDIMARFFDKKLGG